MKECLIILSLCCYSTFFSFFLHLKAMSEDEHSENEEELNESESDDDEVSKPALEVRLYELL